MLKDIPIKRYPTCTPSQPCR